MFACQVTILWFSVDTRKFIFESKLPETSAQDEVFSTSSKGGQVDGGGFKVNSEIQ
jgi:hypothetical protein